MQTHLNIVGFLLVVLAPVHLYFPRYLNWEKELKPLSLINRQVMTVHTFFIAFTVLLMGLLCLTSSKDLIETRLGRTISLGFGVFWLVRLLIQFFGYSAELWKGKPFETTMHILFTVLWTYLSVVFLTIWCG